MSLPVFLWDALDRLRDERGYRYTGKLIRDVLRREVLSENGGADSRKEWPVAEAVGLDAPVSGNGAIAAVPLAATVPASAEMVAEVLLEDMGLSKPPGAQTPIVTAATYRDDPQGACLHPLRMIGHGVCQLCGRKVPGGTA